MQRDPRAFLWDVRESALAIQAFTADMDVAAYAANEMAQAAVERKFEIIGEALNRAVILEPTLEDEIPEFRQIVGLRNRVIHGYDVIDDEIEEALRQRLDLDVVFESDAADTIKGLAALLRFR